MFWEKLVSLTIQPFRLLHVFYIRPIKKIVVFQVPCQKKTGSVGRLYFFNFFYFFFFYFFLVTVQTSSSFFSLFSSKKYRQCYQAVDPGDMYYGRSFINSGKS